jgi:hypothetical protein
MLRGQGTALYTEEELYTMMEEDVNVLEVLLNGHDWILGTDKPTFADACLYGFTAAVLTAGDMYARRPI